MDVLCPEGLRCAVTARGGRLAAHDSGTYMRESIIIIRGIIVTCMFLGEDSRGLCHLEPNSRGQEEKQMAAMCCCPQAPIMTPAALWKGQVVKLGFLQSLQAAKGSLDDPARPLLP